MDAYVQLVGVITLPPHKCIMWSARGYYFAVLTSSLVLTPAVLLFLHKMSSVFWVEWHPASLNLKNEDILCQRPGPWGTGDHSALHSQYGDAKCDVEVLMSVGLSAHYLQGRRTWRPVAVVKNINVWVLRKYNKVYVHSITGPKHQRWAIQKISVHTVDTR